MHIVSANVAASRRLVRCVVPVALSIGLTDVSASTRESSAAVSAPAPAAMTDARDRHAAPTATFVALSVPDLEASARWYETTFALERIMTVPRTGAMAGVIALEGSGLLVELIQLDSARAATERPELTHGVAKVGFIVDDFDGLIATLRSRGVEFFAGPYAPRPGMRANAMFRDNAGNVWQVMGRKG